MSQGGHLPSEIHRPEEQHGPSTRTLQSVDQPLEDPYKVVLLVLLMESTRARVCVLGDLPTRDLSSLMPFSPNHVGFVRDELGNLSLFVIHRTSCHQTYDVHLRNPEGILINICLDLCLGVTCTIRYVRPKMTPFLKMTRCCCYYIAS